MVATPQSAAARLRAGTWHCESAVTPGRKRDLGGASEPVVALAVGAGGIEELARHIDSGTVSWALLRFQVGGGTFVRTKLVLIHSNGADCGVMLRGWLNARSQEVISQLGEVHCNLEVSHGKELTIEHVCQRVLPVLAGDNLDYSMQRLRQEYGALAAQMEEEAKRKKLEKKLETVATVTSPLSPVEEAPAVSVTLEEALHGVGEDRGPFNWLLLEPVGRTQLNLRSAGHGGYEEMKASLAEDKVLFGVLRLSFGCSTRQTASGGRTCPGITKHVFIHWVGPVVGAVQRGLWNSKFGRASALIGSHCSVTFTRQAHDLDGLALKDIISELRRLTVVDGAAGCMSPEEYVAALEEEIRDLKAQAAAAAARAQEAAQAAEAAPAQEVDAEEAAEERPNLRTAVETVRSLTGGWNWVICGWPRLPSAAVPGMASLPSPCRASVSEKLPPESRRNSTARRISLPPSPCRATGSALPPP